MRPVVSSGFRAAHLAVIVYILLYIYTSTQHALFLSLCAMFIFFPCPGSVLQVTFLSVGLSCASPGQLC